MDTQEYYAGNFSRIQAYAALTSSELSDETRRDLARRMLDYPKVLESDPVLELLALQLARSSATGRYACGLAWPITLLEKAVLRLQDHWESVQFIEDETERIGLSVHRVPAPVDWARMAVEAERAYKEHATNNPFAVDNNRWQTMYKAIAAARVNKLSDGWLSTNMDEATGWWTDLGLVLRVLKDAGARPTIVCMPMHGVFFDACNVSDKARHRLYQRLRDEVSKYGFPIATFQEHDGDPSFFLDFSPHLGPKGWVYYDRMFDACFHDWPLDPAAVVLDLDGRAAEASAHLLRPVAPVVSTPGATIRGTDPGTLDGLGDDGAIVGWAWDSDRPNVPIAVEVYIDGSLAGRTPADQLRPDLTRMGKGLGNHAYAFPVPQRSCDGRVHKIAVKNVATGEWLIDSPQELLLQLRRDVATTQVSPATRPVDAEQPETPGTLDDVSADELLGWAWDKNRSAESVTVEIYDGPKRIASVRADVLRQDLLNAGIGDGRHSFSIRVPDAIRDGKPHQISARIAGGKELSGSPARYQYVAPAAAPPGK